MADLSGLRTGVATRLATISGLNSYDTVPGSVVTPAAIVEVATIDYDAAMGRGADDITLAVRLLVSAVVDDVAQGKLDAYLAGSGATSVKAAIEADGTLGGRASFAVVPRVRTYGLIDYAGVQYLGAVLDVEITAAGS